jgi:hypothetical protein
MTIDEARGNIGNGVAYKSGTDEAEEGVIAKVGRIWVFVQYPGEDCPVADRPEDLTLLSR